MLVPGSPYKSNCPTCRAVAGTPCKLAMPCQARVDLAPLIEIPDDWEAKRDEIFNRRKGKGSSRPKPGERRQHKIPGHWFKSIVDDDIL